MFTGIITEIGTVTHASRSSVTIHASRPFMRKLKIGASVSVDGACLTLVAKAPSSFVADIIPETARRTTLGELCKGNTVNLELPATPASFLSGHIVQGHVDGVGTLKSKTTQGNSKTLSITVSPQLASVIVEQGSIAVDGISLTVIKAQRSGFSVGIIPRTWNTTTLHTIKKGDRVNIEADVIIKYAKRLLRTSTL